MPSPTTIRPGGFVDVHQGGRRIDPPQPWELTVLRLLAEQGAIPFDQLARFLGAAEHQAAAIAKHLTDRGFADYGSILHGEPHWLWLTWRGSRASGTGFGALPPKVGAMSRIRALNEIRLHICARAPHARWRCGRTVFREQGKRGHRPNAIVECDGERHAILVLLRPGARERLVPRLETLLRRHDALIVFTTRRSRPNLERLADQHHWPRVVLRNIPTSEDWCSATGPIQLS